MRHLVKIIPSLPLAECSAASARAALSEIPGVEEIAVEYEEANGVVLSYRWARGNERFDQTDEVLGTRGLARDWTFDPLAG